MLYPLSYGGVIRTSLERVTTRRGATTLTAGEVSLKSRSARTDGRGGRAASERVWNLHSSEQTQVMFLQELRLFPEPVRRFGDKDAQSVCHD